VALKDISTSESLYVFNTHFDHGGRWARRESARLVLDSTKEISGDVPFVITGDFNNDEQDPVQVLTADGSIADARVVSQTPHAGPKNTFTGWRDEFAKIIDYIFVKKAAWDVKRHQVHVGAGTRKLSDHRMLTVDLERRATAGVSARLTDIDKLSRSSPGADHVEL